MEAVRDMWTDERMDDLNHRVDRGFDAVDRRLGEVNREFQATRLEARTEFAAVRSEMRTEFTSVRSEMGAEFASLRMEMQGMGSELSGQTADLHRTMVRLCGGMFATMVIGFLAILLQL